MSVNGAPQFREGSADSYKRGSLIRRLEPIRLANLSASVSSSVPSATYNWRVEVRGLTSGLTVHIATTLAVGGDASSQDPIEAADYPATPGTMQLTPVIDNGQAPRTFLRPVFQDPTKVTNTNVPLPQNLPFGWSFVSEGVDDVVVDISVPLPNYENSDIEGTLICFATIEYTGSWWDTKAVEQAIGQVRMVSSQNEAITFNTSSE